MGLADEYRRQFEWRDWQDALGALPALEAQLVLDLGCGPGDLAAWRARFARMALLRERCGAAFEGVQEDFLAALARPEHTSNARVVACVARA
jgi:SAM-dependent methyltransferase